MASEIIEKDIYNGRFHITHNPNARGRAPRYKVGDTKPLGVTTILGKTLSKDLMQWAVDMAIAYLQDKQPIITEKDLKEASRAYITKRDFGANTGTAAHELVELYLKGKADELDAAFDEASQEAVNAYSAFLGWFEEAEAEVINVEEVIYSAKYEYAGTYDCMLEIDGKVYLCDFKTTNSSKKAPKGVYPEHFLQLGAYANAHEEQRVYEEKHGGTELRPIEGLMVISGKKNGQIDIVTNEDVKCSLELCMSSFRGVKALYDFMQETTKKLGG